MALTRAKRIFECSLVTEFGFPSSSVAVSQAKESIVEAKNLFEAEEDEEVEPGMCIFSPRDYHSYTTLDYVVDRNMIKLVCVQPSLPLDLFSRHVQITDVAPTFRGDLKKFIRNRVAVGYSLFPDPKAKNPATGQKYTSEERVAYCVKQVKHLVEDGNFLNSGMVSPATIVH